MGSWEDPARTASKLALELTGDGPSPYTVRRGKNAAQWLLLCALCHPDGAQLRLESGAPAGCVFWEDYTPWRITFSEYQPQEAGRGAFVSRASAPGQGAVPPAPGADCLSLSLPAGGGDSRQGGGLQAGGGAGRQPGNHPVPPCLAGRAGHDPGGAGHGSSRLYAVRGLCRRPGPPGARAGPAGGAGPPHPGAGPGGGPEPGGEFLEGPLGQRVLRSPQVEKERRFTAEIPASLVDPAAADTEEGGHSPGGGGLHLCGGRQAAHHRL